MGTDKFTLPAIIQPNVITSAHYDYSQMQKDFMYHFIEKMNKYMTKDHAIIRDLFGNIEIEMDLKDIAKSDNVKPMINAIKDLMKRPISYNYNRDNATYEVTTTLIASMVYKRGTGKIRIKSTEESLPFLFYIGSGFTAFNKTIALSIPSYYAKRIYELCCRWKDKGFYRVTIKEFRKMMVIENKFKNNADMAKNVLDLSEKLLTEHADVTFTYKFRRENGSRAFNWIELNIFPAMGEAGEKKSGWYSSFYNSLYPIFRDLRAVLVCDYLLERDELKRASERFKRLVKDIDTGRIKSHGIMAYVCHVLVDEYNVPEQMLEGKEAKKKRKKAEEKFAVLKAKKEAAERKKEEAKKQETLTGEEISQVAKRIHEKLKEEEIKIAAERTKTPNNDLFKTLLEKAEKDERGTGAKSLAELLDGKK